MKLSLRENIAQKITLCDEAFDGFYSKFKQLKFNKKEYLLKPGRICGYHYFIVEGLVRKYYINERGKEVITTFALENWWVTDLESFIRRTPSEINIQAVEATKVLAISRANLEKAYDEVPVLNRFFRMQMENMAIALERRQNIYQKAEGKERYDGFLQRFPEFCQRVPQYMLASYLNLTPEYLSEIRRR